MSWILTSTLTGAGPAQLGAEGKAAARCAKVAAPMPQAAVKAEPNRRWRTVHDHAGQPVDLAPIEPPPCDDCPHRARCAAGLACAAFGRYLERGREDYWCHAPREPSAELFALMEVVPQRGGVRSKGQTFRHW